jgi:hypothetical protein
VESGRAELKRVTSVTGDSEVGIRMHWLLRDGTTCQLLEEAGYSYDSTAGYNEAPGYLCGTTQVFRPLSARTVLELPLHIQDGALFYPKRLGLSEADAWKRCEAFIANAQKLGGVLTVLWHERSPGPERFWGEFYTDLVQQLKSLNVWFGTGRQVVAWFRRRREVTFERVDAEPGKLRIKAGGSGQPAGPPLRVRIHSAEAAGRADLPWDGAADIELELSGKVSGRPPENALSATARV